MDFRALPQFNLSESSPTAHLFLDLDIADFHRAARHVSTLPFVDGTEREDWEERVLDGQGTRAAAHALVARLAAEHGVPVELMLGVYEMNEANTPAADDVLRRFGMTAVLDADCHLRYGGERLLLTPGVSVENRVFLHEAPISPDQIGAYKLVVYQRFLWDWTLARGLELGRAWEVRQACVAALAEASRSVGI
ncbi:hypothetical protein [Longimicrobium terrae]|uniref:Uncharacterized protein n=1 Tax=Longimicrobium terrae TaxID=1639882 RepID=A0A841H4M2_9BACT|nr:hypothetical protein [Longimicrobium terrae]MBB4638673.1 hypothetical protein [Longimicrobium terrae]MBB6072913.1 hypothetical protein [Longimicrobium terrae]NNC31526.1 hypothetical protein [Longimicrobium terrae]